MGQVGLRVNLAKYTTKSLAPLLGVLLLMPLAVSVHAESGTIKVMSSSAVSEFPAGLRFRLEASSDDEITSVAVRFKTGQQTTGSYDYLGFETGNLIDSELFWRTNTSARYIPPGTIIKYNFEIEDSAGNRLDTEVEEFIYQDARFNWEEITEGPVSVAYHGPVKTRAQIILDAITQTLQHMGPLLGADTEEPIRVTMYNNVKEMLGGLPPGSTTIRRELITEGQAFVNVGTLLVLGGGRGAKGTASHEVTHILTHRAGDSVFRSVPSWLDEGLAEYGNIDPGFSYDIALEFALATDRLLPITSMPVLPGNPDDVIIFYGQGRSVVRFMIAAFGADKMRELMATMKSGRKIDDAIEDVYGVGRIQLENLWRTAIGAPLFSPEGRERARPTPIARPAVQPYSLTPQPQASDIGDKSSTPTPEPKPAETPTAEPTVALAKASQSEETEETTSPRTGSSACSVPVYGEARTLDIAAIALMVGLAGLGLRRRIRR